MVASAVNLLLGVTMRLGLANFGFPSELVGADLRTCFDFYKQHGTDRDYSVVRIAIRRFLNSEFRGLYLWGKNGSGKSYIASAVMAFLHSRNISVRRTTVFSLVEEYKANTFAVPQAYYDVDVLLLEEMGKHIEWKTDIVSPILENMLKQRFESGKRCVFTANCGVSQLESMYGATVSSMLRGFCIPAQFPQFDWRVALNSDKVSGG